MKKPQQDGHEIWRAVTRTVRPLRKAPPAPPPARVHVPAQHVRPDPPAQIHATAHRPSAARVVVTRSQATSVADRSPEKRIRRGRVDVEARLDLHGMTQVEAQGALARFLAHHRDEGARCVLVVTGKGRGEAGGVLKAALPRWLSAMRPAVSGYAQAHQKHGGGGAWYVFLKARD